MTTRREAVSSYETVSINQRAKITKEGASAE
jgi:hypothetical protein